MEILKVLPRVNLSDLSENLDFYSRLFNANPKGVFPVGESQIAMYDHLLLVAGSGSTNKITATIVVNSILEAKEFIITNGGKVIIDPVSVPTGLKMIVQHPDGQSFEYIEPNQVKS